MAGRFGLATPAMALATQFARQKSTPASSGTLPTHSLSFWGLPDSLFANAGSSELSSCLGHRSRTGMLAPRSTKLGSQRDINQ
jgi:hypothetical protein